MCHERENRSGQFSRTDQVFEACMLMEEAVEKNISKDDTECSLQMAMKNAGNSEAEGLFG